MNYPLVDAALRDFNDDLSRIRRLLEFVLEFHVFASSTPPQDARLNWPQADDLHELSKPLRTDLPILSGAILLYLAGRFEYFVRQTVEAATDYLVAAAPAYDQLPESIRRHLHTKTLDVARDASKHRLGEVEVFQLLANLVERERPGSKEVQVDSWLISQTDSNMRPDVLDEILKRIGIEGFWTEIGKQTELKLFIGQNGDGLCKQEARQRLTEIMKERNDVAHPTGNIKFPSAEEVLHKADYLLLIGRLLTSHTVLHLRTS